MKTVLIVDDEYAIAETLQDFLEDEGFAVRNAANGMQALERMSQERPDVVLMDVMMPILGGVETVRRMRQTEALKDVPVVFMSSAPRSVIDPDVQAMASGFFRKPSRLQPLVDTIKRLTGG